MNSNPNAEELARQVSSRLRSHTGYSENILERATEATLNYYLANNLRGSLKRESKRRVEARVNTIYKRNRRDVENYVRDRQRQTVVPLRRTRGWTFGFDPITWFTIAYQIWQALRFFKIAIRMILEILKRE